MGAQHQSLCTEYGNVVEKLQMNNKQLVFLYKAMPFLSWWRAKLEKALEALWFKGRREELLTFWSHS